VSDCKKKREQVLENLVLSFFAFISRRAALLYFSGLPQHAFLLHHGIVKNGKCFYNGADNKTDECCGHMK